MNRIVPRPEDVAILILHIRGEKVLLSGDLAALYGISPKALNQAYRRNIARFPADFAFQLSPAEAEATASLRSQFA